MFIYSVCNSLEKAKVPYAIVGGYAVALHGAPRGTVDIDIVISWTLDNLKKAQDILIKELGLVSRIPVNAENVFQFREEYIQKKHLVAWNFYDPKNPSKQVDLIITYDLPSTSIKNIHTERGIVSVLAKEELILMKQKSGRPQDLADIEALKQL